MTITSLRSPDTVARLLMDRARIDPRVRVRAAGNGVAIAERGVVRYPGTVAWWHPTFRGRVEGDVSESAVAGRMEWDAFFVFQHVAVCVSAILMFIIGAATLLSGSGLPSVLILAAGAFGLMAVRASLKSVDTVASGDKAVVLAFLRAALDSEP